MEEALNMSESYSKDVVDYIASEMVVDHSYIEKDFYATQILKKLADFTSLDHRIIFSGGTSLSKGYGLIKRFSEDLDFEIDASGTISQGQRKTIRHDFLDAISEIPEIEIINTYAENGGRKQTLSLKYPHLYPIPDNLRDHLKVELFFEPMEITTEERTINSFISTYTEQNLENVKILCNHPFNIMADKFNALTWRIYDSDDTFDYTTMRHLHDLYAIHQKYNDPERFKKRVLDNFEKKDSQRVHDKNFIDLLKETNKKLLTETIYKKGYEKFVDSMSYAPDNERISYDMALKDYQDLSKLFY